MHTCTLLLFETRNKRLSDTHFVQPNTSTLIEGTNTPFIDSRLKTLEFQLYIVLLQLFELNSSDVSMLQSFSEYYMSFNFKRETRLCTCVFHRKHSNGIIISLYSLSSFYVLFSHIHLSSKILNFS